jgi:O-Antigen ligase
MPPIKKFSHLLNVEIIIFSIFTYFCFEYKSFEHRLYHVIYKIVKPFILIKADLPFDMSFFLSDILILIGIIFVIKSQKSPLVLINKKSSFFLLLFSFIAFVSILSCPYEKDLSRIFQVLSLFFAFLFFNILIKISKKQVVISILKIICIIAVFEAVLSIYQYFTQTPLGLFKLGEPKLLKNVNTCAIIPSFNGKKWIFELFKTDSLRLFRAYGTFSHPNILACFFITSILSSTYFWFQDSKLKKIGIGIFIFLQLIALFLTFSRMAIATIFLIFYGLIFFIKNLKSKTKILYSFVFLIFFLINITLFFPVLEKRGSFSVSNKFTKNSNQQRITTNMIALKIIKKHYLLGIGFDHFMKNAHHFNKDYKVTTTVHNIYLLIAAEMGLMAFTCFMGFIFFVFLKLQNLNDDLLTVLVMVFISYLILGMVDYYFLLTQKGKIMFFGVAGLIVGYADYLQSSKLAQSAGKSSILYSDELKAKC